MQRIFLAVLLLAATLGFSQPLPRKAVFGAQLMAVTPEQRTASGLKDGEGVALGNVIANLSAAQAGLLTGDILISVDGTAVGTPQDVVRAFRLKNGGETTKLVYVRAGKREEKTITMVERPKQKPDGFDVIYDQVESLGKRIRVIITKPQTSGKHAAVMLIGGIGAYSVDGDFPGVAYGNIMGPIAKAGYVTVRIDKPGLGDSEGPIYTELLFSVELDAYRQTLKKLPSYDFIDANKINIFGHSMGGAFGPILASEIKLNGVCVGGTVCKNWIEYFIENTRRQALLGGMAHAQVGDYIRRVAAFQHYLFYEGKSPDEIVKARPELAATVREQTPDGKTYSGVGLPFWQELCKINFEEHWSKVDAYLMSFWGENDFISTEEDHPMMVKIVNEKHPGKAEYVKLANSDHGFFKTTSMLDSLQKWGRGGSAFNPNVVEAILKWLEKVNK
ncbi:MAG: alpha/beta fold hydrolase [Methanoregulaceae archaeon]|nr:alpha/beta fold hydrolase [Methanoregulaceae archaeon]